ncbi:MAG: hypothetical protein JRM80_13785, partial [Nitrososphaerota archaeon]|nr:hypothetical protein [Nitrososphaerota archaeon]
SGNRRHVGPIVRPTTMTSEETRRKYGIPGGPFILFSASGSGAGMELALRLAGVRDEAAPGVPLVISGNRGDKVSGSGVYDLGVLPDNQNLVACADLVVSTAGKSTIDEASAAGTPMIAIPIRHHAEQERNALALGYRSDDGRRLAELVREKLGKREKAQAYSGEKRAAELLTSLLVSGRP